MLPLAAILIPSAVDQHYYSTFYLLAFLLNQGLLLWEGQRRGYPLRPWLLLTTGATLAFIVGTKLIAIPAAEWAALWQHGEWPSTTARSVLGGAIGGTLGVLVLRRWLGFRWHVVDAFALPMCAAYALQCVGCLLTGCCFGHLAPAGWGVLYAPDTLPFLVQVERGLILPTALHSLPVLPTQLFTLALCLITLAVLWSTRHRTWPGGSWRLLQLALLLSGRFIIEFARDPAGEQVGAALSTVAGVSLKQVQWTLLPLLLLSWGWWWQRTRAAQALAPDVQPPARPMRNLLTVAGLLAVTALLGPGALTLPEMLIVKAGLTVVLVLEVLALLHYGAARPRQMGLPLGLASMVLLFTNQAPAPSDSSAVRRYLTLGVGAGNGRYDEDIVDRGGCGSSATRTAYYHRYQVAGGSVAYSTVRPSGNVTTLGLGVWRGAERIGIQSLDPNGPFITTGEDTRITKQLWDVNPYVESRFGDGGHWEVGYRLGLHIGQLGFPSRRLRRELSGNTLGYQLAPDMMIWTGVRKTLFMQSDIGAGPIALGNNAIRLGLGSGFGKTDGSYLLGGVAWARHHPQGTMGFLSGQISVAGNSLLLEPYAATDFQRHYQLRAQLRYRIPLAKK
ncbi:prolipoprotein diacylglyceryl transferase family protein [Hymenobacter koreensis]|uniref:Phosphatidylglycerol:prolipoprotein diacylglycerol transferase n=1 Tax=Hymenobacter koreensis TaxID=1084523 RepID=A0ABP8IYS5_9BACT